ncbi:MAG TPA: hypothetical protein VFM69_01250 [Pricia sp.]|nr:hypothetical protein [Pricia sp.]
MEGEIILRGITVTELISKISDIKKSGYDPKIGFSKKRMMEELEISSDTTFYDRLKRGKIASREVGGSNRYFFP